MLRETTTELRIFETVLCMEKSIAVLILKATFNHLVLFKYIVIV